MTADPTHLEMLERGLDEWNAWRAANPDIQPVLSGADLSELDLAGANLSEADLAGADLFQTDLHRANLKMSRLTGADLSGAKLAGADMYKADLSNAFLTQADLSKAYVAGADLRGADLRGASLRGTILADADLSSANLSEADLTGADMSRATIDAANLCSANVASARLLELRYGSFKSMNSRYYGIRGLDTCFGNALFVRDAKDQDYLDTLANKIDQTQARLPRWLKRLLFSAWGRIDYGRSFGRPTLYAVALVTAFGLVYWLDMVLGWGLIDYSDSVQSRLSPFYYSIVAYTTLEVGDITPISPLGQVIVVSEVVLGYLTLGLLLSILANKVARRS